MNTARFTIKPAHNSVKPTPKKPSAVYHPEQVKYLCPNCRKDVGQNVHGRHATCPGCGAIYVEPVVRKILDQTKETIEQEIDRLVAEDIGQCCTETGTHSENPHARAELKFKAIALAQGFRHKVVGDYAYTKTYSPTSPIIKLRGARNGKLQIYQSGLGRYEADIDKPM